eukprot:m.647580 g.647580  ORF g.647580 m.647580 type:complete len:83 (+) comp22658_c2_seq2:191-439(+)
MDSCQVQCDLHPVQVAPSHRCAPFLRVMCIGAMLQGQSVQHLRASFPSVVVYRQWAHVPTRRESGSSTNALSLSSSPLLLRT